MPLIFGRPCSLTPRFLVFWTAALVLLVVGLRIQNTGSTTVQSLASTDIGQLNLSLLIYPFANVNGHVPL